MPLPSADNRVARNVISRSVRPSVKMGWYETALTIHDPRGCGTYCVKSNSASIGFSNTGEGCWVCLASKKDRKIKSNLAAIGCWVCLASKKDRKIKSNSAAIGVLGLLSKQVRSKDKVKLGRYWVFKSGAGGWLRAEVLGLLTSDINVIMFSLPFMLLLKNG